MHLSKGRQSSVLPYCMRPALAHSGKGTNRGTAERSGVASGWREGGVNMCSTGGFYGGDSLLYETVMVDMCHRFVKTH